MCIKGFGRRPLAYWAMDAPLDRSSAQGTRRIAVLAGLALAFTLVVVVASALLRRSGDPVAGILLSSGQVQVLRLIHRIAATAELALAVALVWAGWRVRRPRPDLFDLAMGALAVTGFLAAIGAAGGQRPGLLVATGNLLGGLLLASMFAWIGASAGRETPARPRRLLSGVLVAQGIGGAMLSLAWRATDGPLLVHLIHLLVGISLGLGLLAWAVGRARSASVAIAAVLAPTLGLLALLLPDRGLWALLHGAAVATLLAATAIAIARA